MTGLEAKFLNKRLNTMLIDGATEKMMKIAFPANLLYEKMGYLVSGGNQILSFCACQIGIKGNFHLPFHQFYLLPQYSNIFVIVGIPANFVSPKASPKAQNLIVM